MIDKAQENWSGMFKGDLVTARPTSSTQYQWRVQSPESSEAELPPRLLSFFTWVIL
jgi:hypothetical protein